MILTFAGPHGSFESRWIVYAMLRDNVQHHLEGGVPSEAFKALHSLRNVVSNGKARVSALALRDQARRASVLTDRPIRNLAGGIRTGAVTTGVSPLQEAHDTFLPIHSGWALPFTLKRARTLGDLFGGLLRELMRVTEGAGRGDFVSVHLRERPTVGVSF